MDLSTATAITPLETLISAIAYRSPEHLAFVLMGYALTFAVLWSLGGRAWAMIYVALIPFVNWSFGWAPNISLPFAPEFGFNPVTIVTGLVLVVRDFTQQEMKHRVLFAMLIGVGWSFYYASPNIALASATAFAIAELVDWALFTFTRFRLSTRIMLSSAIAAPLDTTIFLIGAKFLTFPNWVMSIIGKLFGAAIVSGIVRTRETHAQTRTF
ncbi:VUT family protein [Hirschia litorea]|uniref:VUT family protein n=1 Tax=Hirschia litorea TaxID=1199156 RepID=A0ABW2ILL5_9PROT